MSAPSSRLRAYRIPALVVAVLLLIAVAVATVWGIRGFAHSTERVEHSHWVLGAVEGVESEVRSAESSARGYRLTGLPTQEAEYLAAVPRAQEQSTRLELTADNPQQHRLARQMMLLVRERLDSIERLVVLQNQQGAEYARQAMLASGGTVQTRRIVALAREMRTAESVRLDKRKVASAMRANLLIGFVVLGIVLPMGLMALLLASLTHENRRSLELEREAWQAVRDLEDSLVQRDRLSEQRRSLGAYAGLLQSCQNLDEAMTLTANIVSDLLPSAAGRCYVLRASQNLAATAARFGTEHIVSTDLLQPEQCWALRRGQPHRTDDKHGHMRCAHLDGDAAMTGLWTLCVPLMAQGTSLGLLHVSAKAADVDGEADAALLEAIAEQLSLAMINLQLRETLRVQSLRDPLTGLFNRRYLTENLQRELLRCERRGLPLSVLMLDVDHFKHFNDQHGHAAGDALLARIGQTLDSLTRNEDIACRYGGEEFTVVLPETGAADARRRAEEILVAMATTTIIHLRQSLGPATTSIGIATFPEDGTDPELLLGSADAALYRAKAAGRNRIEDSA